MLLLNLLLTTTTPVADWISKSFPIIRTVLIILIALFAFTVLYAVLAQPSKPAGGRNVILGTNSESYYSKNKSNTKEGRLNKVIIISAICIFVLALLYFLSYIPYAAD